jgi:hypothetical protein
MKTSAIWKNYSGTAQYAAALAASKISAVVDRGNRQSLAHCLFVMLLLLGYQGTAA